VTQAYNHLWFPSAAGQLVSHEIRTAGGEGGTPVIEMIRSTLRDAGELLTADKATTQETLISLATLFFEVGQTPTLEVLLQRFASDRRWPVQEEAMLLEQIVRAGARGIGVCSGWAAPSAQNQSTASAESPETCRSTST
jgi:hypothetical protein